MSTMQGAFIGSGTSLGNIVHSGEIKIKTPNSKNENNTAGITRYSLRYTPKSIFSGDIPAFDTNFFNPMGNDKGVVQFMNTEMKFKTVKQGIDYNYCKSNYGATGSLLTSKDKFTTSEAIASALGIICTINAVESLANIDNDVDWGAFGAGGGGSFFGIGGEVDVDFSIPIFEMDLQGMTSAAMFTAGAAAAGATYVALESQDENMYYKEWQKDGKTYFFIAESSNDIEGDKRNKVNGAIYEIQEKKASTVNEKYSAAFQLRPIISSWYKALRNFSLVGLLSILVYVGIRIVLSSTSEQKAKYKKRLLDWLVALCLIFFLHYIMVFVTYISEALCTVFKTEGNLSDGTDIFATKIRNMATGDGVSSYMQYFGFVVIYIALTVLTVIFTIQYTKRLVILAFLTMIAPLITLTYPLDTMGDGKPQAFSFWLREYIFNSLLQPMHLLLYTIFISSAYDLMDMNPVYAIIVLSFFVSAEQIFRKIFGFDKANTVNALGAAAGGAMMMNMLNKVRGGTRRRGGNSSNNSSNEKGIRMARENMEDNRQNYLNNNENRNNINLQNSNSSSNNRGNRLSNNSNNFNNNNSSNNNSRNNNSYGYLGDDFNNNQDNRRQDILNNNDNADSNNYDFFGDDWNNNPGNRRLDINNTDYNNNDLGHDYNANNNDLGYDYIANNNDLGHDYNANNNDLGYNYNTNNDGFGYDNYNNNNNYSRDNLTNNLGNGRQDISNNSGNTPNSATKMSRRKPNIGQGVKNVAKGIGKRSIKGAASITKGVFKKVPGAIAGATIGIAAAVASGGQNAGSIIGAGIVSGAAISNNISEGVSDTIKSGVKNIKQDFDRGAQKPSTKKEKLKGYEKVIDDKKVQEKCKKDGVNVEDTIESFIDKGITDPNKIKSTIESGVTHPDKIDSTSKDTSTSHDKIESTTKSSTKRSSKINSSTRSSTKRPSKTNSSTRSRTTPPDKSDKTSRGTKKIKQDDLKDNRSEEKQPIKFYINKDI